jgi:hypothetical protein
MKARITAIITAVSVLIGVLGMSGCADTREAMTIDGVEILAGEYIHAQLEAAQEAAADFIEANPDVVTTAAGFDFFAQELDGKSFTDLVNDRAVEICKERVFIARHFDELGLEFTSDDELGVRREVDELWDTTGSFNELGLNHETWGEFFESTGIGKASLNRVMTNVIKAERVFQAYFGAEGLRPVSEEELKEEFAREYVRFRVIDMSLVNDDGEVITDQDELKMLADLAGSYAERLSAGELFSSVDADYQNFERERRLALMTPELNDEVTPTPADGDEELPTHTAVDEVIPTPEEATPEGTPVIFDENNNDLLESINDPYFSWWPEGMADFLFNLELNEAGIFEQEDAIFVFLRLDVNEREDWFNDTSDNLLRRMKGDEMQEITQTGANALSITLNDAAIRRYDPRRVAVKGFLTP